MNTNINGKKESEATENEIKDRNKYIRDFFRKT